MTTPVNSNLAKLLKEKGFDEYCKLCVEEGDERPLPFNAGNTLHKNSLHPYYSAPTIAEVIMWLYEKHGIWITSEPYAKQEWETVTFIYKIFRNGYVDTISRAYLGFNLPTEAYLAAIEYVLTKLI